MNNKTGFTLTSRPTTYVHPAVVDGSSLKGFVEIAPARLVDIFGAPLLESHWHQGVSGEYTFVSADGKSRFKVYDWQPKHPLSERALWWSTEPFRFHVGGYSGSDASDFIAWIKAL